MFVVMDSGKCELHTYLTFLQRILTSTHENLMYIFLIFVAISNIHFFGLDNVKMICITHTFPSKLLLGKDVFTLTFFDLENETSVSIWGFE
jgi:hypothetical protein